MARPEEQGLILARGIPAPQVWDERKGKYVVATGTDGAIHYIDKDRSKTFYMYKEEGEPDEALKGDTLFYFDDSSVYVFDGNKWVAV